MVEAADVDLFSAQQFKKHFFYLVIPFKVFSLFLLGFGFQFAR